MFVQEFSGLNSSFQGLKFVRWWGTAPLKEKVKKEDRTLGNVGSGYKLCIVGDLNGWIGNRTGAGITGAFGVPGKNDNSRRMVEFCEKRGLCVSNTYFKHRNVQSTQEWQGVESVCRLRP